MINENEIYLEPEWKKTRWIFWKFKRYEDGFVIVFVMVKISS